MISQRRRPGEKLFEGGRVFFVLKFLRLVTGIEVVLELSAKIHFFKRIARGIRCGVFARFQSPSFSIAAGGDFTFRFRHELNFSFGIGSIRGRCARLRRCRFHCLPGQTIQITTAGHVVENLFGQLLRLFLGRNFLEHRIFVQLLLDQIRQLERSHLQHLDPLSQLGRQDETLGKTGSKSD